MKSIIIVDDDERIIELIRVNLEARGHRVVKTITSCLELLESLKTAAGPDVLILDLLLDNDFGTDMLGSIYEKWKDTKVYIFTGYSEYEEDYPFIKDLVEAVFMKPDPETLLKAIDNDD